MTGVSDPTLTNVRDSAAAANLRWNADGLIPVVTQDATSKAVLMLAWMNAEALAATLSTGRATYFSRSRQRLWIKGESSGHTQTVREVRHDCDGDTLLLSVDQVGGACHTGDATCFDAGLLELVGSGDRGR